MSAAAVLKPLTLSQIDLSKLSLVSESAARAMVAAGDAEVPRVKRIRKGAAVPSTQAEAREPLVFVYDGDVMPWIQLGRGRDIEHASAVGDLLMCWSGLRRYEKTPNKYFTVESASDVAWVAGELAAQTKAGKGKPSGQLRLELAIPHDVDTINGGDNEAARLVTLLARVNELVYDAMCNGVPHVDANGKPATMCWFPKDDPKRAMTREFAVRTFASPFQEGGRGVGKNGVPFAPQVRLRARWYAEEGGARLSLKAPVCDIATGKPTTRDPFASLKRARGKFIVSLGDVRYKSANEVNMTIELERCAVGQREYKAPTVVFADDDDLDETACAAAIDAVSASTQAPPADD